MSVKAINDHVRRRLRELRTAKKIGFREMAESTGIPASSYCCMESGYYKISLDNLYRILGVLDADIHDVWPADAEAADSQCNPVYLRRIQDFRLSEVISLSGADGAALFSISGGKVSVLMHQNLSESLIDRLCFCLEDRRTSDQGMFLSRKRGDHTFVFFLKASTCPAYVAKLVERYLVIWSNLFGSIL